MVNATAVTSARKKVRVREIAERDVAGVVDLLARGFPERPHAFWAAALARLARHSPPDDLPRFGYLLESDGVPVGAILLIFSSMPAEAGGGIRGNVSSWYVEPSYRSYATFLSARALSLPHVTYLNVTAAPHTRPIALAQGYARYTAGTFAAVPVVRLSFKGRVSPFDPRRHLSVTPFERELLLAHAEYGCLSLWVETPSGDLPFVFRPRWLKAVIGCAQLIYCRDIEDFVRCGGALGRYLALRGKLFVFIDANGPLPGLAGRYFPDRMPRFFKGPVAPRIGDLAYTEIAMFGV
jgi:hypothetical protein